MGVGQGEERRGGRNRERLEARGRGGGNGEEKIGIVR